MKIMAQASTRSACSVPGCSCNAQKQPYLSFHSFPVDTEVRRLWVKTIRRDEGPNFVIKKGSTFVCSMHFNKEDFVLGITSRRLKTEAVPSLFPWNNFTSTVKRDSVYERCHKRQPLTSVDDIKETAKKALAHDYATPLPTGMLDEAVDYIQDLEAKLKKGLPSTDLFTRYCASDEQMRFYTKFPSESVFKIFWESIAPSASRLVYWTNAQRVSEVTGENADPSPPRSMPLIDEFLIYSFRVAAGMKEHLIADMFQVSVNTVSRVTITWANYLFLILGSIPLWVSREKVRSVMPRKFLTQCPNVRVVLDCTEVAVAAASSLTLQSETFSYYKNRMTLKGLVGVAPHGLVTFLSPLYTSSISDKEITKISGILSLLEPGDEVMADKGFLIDDLLSDVGAKLVIPPFKRSAQFTREDTEKTQSIARLRIVVERVIGRIKSNHIWDSPVPLTLMGTVSQIWHNCCVLVNFQGPLSNEED